MIINKKIDLFYKKQDFADKKRGWVANILPEVFVVLAFLMVLLSSSIFFTNYKYFQIRESSMIPLFNNYENSQITDGVFVRLNSGFDVGDVVVLRFGERNIIKRVVAKGGDKITIVRKVFPSRVEYLVQRIAKGTTVPYTLVEEYTNKTNPNGMQKVYEDFNAFVLSSSSSQKETIFDGDSFVTYLVLEEDEVFYLGDNRGDSLDSSRNGPAKQSDVVGRVEIVVWKEQNFLFNIIAYFLGFKNI